MSRKLQLVLLSGAFVLGIPLGIASHEYPDITNALCILSPFVVLMVSVAFVLPRAFDRTPEAKDAMKSVFHYGWVWAALCTGDFVGLLLAR